MSSIILKNVEIASATDRTGLFSVAIENGLISKIDLNTDESNADLVLDLYGSTLMAGFIDVHNHGAFGIDVNEADTNGLLKIAEFLGANGVTSWMPTLVPDSGESYLRSINAIDRLMELQKDRAVAQAVGVHYEGVFANEKMCGALRPEFFKSGKWAANGGQLPRLQKGVHMTTLAPEVEGGIELIDNLVHQNWIVSIGHTKAETETLDAAFTAGARHLTHFFNAMTGVHHREIGVAGWGLTNADVTFDIIADGIHVHPEMLDLACRSKGFDKVSLISDSVAPTGLGDGDFSLWGETISVTNGRTKNERGSIAGSVITMSEAVKMMLSLGYSSGDVGQMASANPARLLGLDADRGSLKAGQRADLVAIDRDANIELVMIGGKVVEK